MYRLFCTRFIQGRQIFTAFLRQSLLPFITPERGVGDGRHIYICLAIVVIAEHRLGAAIVAPRRTNMSGIVLLSLILTMGVFAYLVYALLKAERF